MRLPSQKILKTVVWLAAVLALGLTAAQAGARIPERPDPTGAPRVLGTTPLAKKLTCQAQRAAQLAAARAVIRWNQLGGNLSQAGRRSDLDTLDTPKPVQLPVPVVAKAC